MEESIEKQKPSRSRNISVAVIEQLSPRYGQDGLKERRKSYALQGKGIEGRAMSRVSVAGGTAPSVLRAENEHSISKTETIIHLVKGNIGAGILALPLAIEHAGLWVGTIGLIFMSICCITCMHMLVECSHLLCAKLGRAYMSYADVAESTFQESPNKTLQKFAKFSRWLINGLLIFTQVGFCCVYFVFIPQNIFRVLQANNACFDYIYIMAITTIPVLLIMSIRNLEWLSPGSLLENLLLFAGFIMIWYYMFQDLQPMSDVPAFGSWAGLPLYFSNAIYAFEGIGVVLPLENQMEEPSKMGGKFGVINIAMGSVTILYMMMGFFGYWQFAGTEIKGSITLNLPAYEWPSQTTQIMMSCGVFLTYPLVMYVVVEIVLPSIQKLTSKFATTRSSKFDLIVELILRYALVMITFGLAAVVPKIDLFINLIGAVSSSSLALIAPPIVHTIVCWDQFSGASGKLKIARNMFLLFLGLAGMISGTILSVKDIIDFFMEGSDGPNFPQC